MIWLWIGLAVAADGAAALVCGLIPDRVLERYRPAMLGFAAGTLLASGLVELLPEAIEHTGPLAFVWAVATMLVLGAIELASARRSRHRDRPVIPMALLGSDALHNLADGMAIAAAFLVSTRLGVITSAAVILHELPEEVADYALLRLAGVRKRAALAGLAVVQLTAGIGAAGTLLASSLLARSEGILVSVACGMFVYIAAIDLLPAVVRTRSRVGFAAGALGAAAVVAIG